MTADQTDTPAADCETVDTTASPTSSPAVEAKAKGEDKVKPRLTQRSSILVLRRGRRVSFYLACRNEKKGCRGTFVIRTRTRVRIAKRRARHYTLARVAFRLTGQQAKALSHQALGHDAEAGAAPPLAEADRCGDGARLKRQSRKEELPSAAQAPLTPSPRGRLPARRRGSVPACSSSRTVLAAPDRCSSRRLPRFCCW